MAEEEGMQDVHDVAPHDYVIVLERGEPLAVIIDDRTITPRQDMGGDTSVLFALARRQGVKIRHSSITEGWPAQGMQFDFYSVAPARSLAT